MYMLDIFFWLHCWHDEFCTVAHRLMLCSSVCSNGGENNEDRCWWDDTPLTGPTLPLWFTYVFHLANMWPGFLRTYTTKSSNTQDTRGSLNANACSLFSSVVSVPPSHQKPASFLFLPAFFIPCALWDKTSGTFIYRKTCTGFRGLILEVFRCPHLSWQHVGSQERCPSCPGWGWRSVNWPESCCHPQIQTRHQEEVHCWSEWLSETSERYRRVKRPPREISVHMK